MIISTNTTQDIQGCNHVKFWILRLERLNIKLKTETQSANNWLEVNTTSLIFTAAGCHLCLGRNQNFQPQI